jgi:uncharacterized lipoprotein YajG
MSTVGCIGSVAEPKGPMQASLWQGVTRIAALIGVVLLSACAWTPHDVQLRPTVEGTASNVGNGTRVFFRFIDDRDDVMVGHRSVATVGAKISAKDLPDIFKARLQDQLQKKQFQLVDAEGSADARVTYRLRSFKFEIEQGFWTGGANAAAALSVDGDRKGRSYAKVYRSNSEERIMAIPGGDAIDNQMNTAMNQLLQQADADEDLTRTLTGQ